MNELLSRHLNDVSIQMGGFLRGFEDSRIHLGAPAQFAREFRNILEAPILRLSNDEVVSYSQAAESWHLPANWLLPAIETEAKDPLLTLIRGLRGRKIDNAISMQEISVESLYEDLRCLLRLPRMRFYLTASDLQLLQCSVEEIAKKMEAPYAFGTREEAQACPSCGDNLANLRNSPIACSRCGLAFESFFEQPMVPSVFAIVSYDMLREVLKLDLVKTYQEEALIQPTHISYKAP